MRRVMKVIRPELSVAENASGNSRSAKRARSSLFLRSRSQSATKEPKSISPQLGFDRPGLEEMHLDEFAELVGDAVLVALDDRGVRDRQAQRPLEQRHHGIPVGEPADGGGFRKGRDEAERGMHVQQQFRDHEQRQRCRQHQGRQPLDAPQLGVARGVAGSDRR